MFGLLVLTLFLMVELLKTGGTVEGVWAIVCFVFAIYLIAFKV